MIDYATPTEQDIYEDERGVVALDLKVVGTRRERDLMLALVTCDRRLKARHEYVASDGLRATLRVQGPRPNLVRLVSELAVPASA
jgi:hypothetical protein